MREKLAKDLDALGWTRATAATGAAALADAADDASTTACLLADYDRVVRDVKAREHRPNGRSLFCARLLIRAGYRVEYLNPSDLFAARTDETVAATLLARLTGDEPPAKKLQAAEAAADDIAIDDVAMKDDDEA